MTVPPFTTDQARHIGGQIGIDWATSSFDVEEFRSRLDVELEHGTQDPSTDVTDDDSIATGKIALALAFLNPSGLAELEPAFKSYEPPTGRHS